MNNIKKKKLKIAIFHLAFFYSGGGEKLVLEEIRGLKSRGHKVDCYTPALDKKLCYPEIIRKYKIKILFPFLRPILFYHESMEIVFSCLLFPFIANRFKNYDVIIGANQPGPWFGWIIKKLTGVPYLAYLAQPTRILYPRKIDIKTGIWVRGKVRVFPFLVRIFKPFINWADRISIKSADRVLTNGEYMSEVISKVYNVNCLNCPAGAYLVKKLTEERWVGRVKANGWIIEKPYILISNRHFPQKKFEYVIKALPFIVKKIPNICVVVTGNPNIYTEWLKKMSYRLGVSKNVFFTGYIQEKDLKALYANAAVYAYTPPEEDFGMGVIESMGAGVPVVAWNRGGPSKTIVSGKTGILVKPNLEGDYCQALIKLIEDRELNGRMGKLARERVVDYFTYKNHVNILEKAILNVYNEISFQD